MGSRIDIRYDKDGGCVQGALIYTYTHTSTSFYHKKGVDLATPLALLALRYSSIPIEMNRRSGVRIHLFIHELLLVYI